MPPKKLKECALIIIDCSANIGERLRYFYKITSTKYFSKCNDINKLLLYNKDGNQLIENVKDWTEYVFDYLQSIREENLNFESQYDCLKMLECLLEAVEFFDMDIVNNNFKRIILISDFTNADIVSKSVELQRKFELFEQKLTEKNIWLYIIGPSVKMPKLCSREDVEVFAKDIRPADHLTDNQKLIIAKFAVILRNIPGIMCDYENGYHLLFSYGPMLLQRFSYYVNLNIGSNINIPVQVSRLTKDYTKVSTSLSFTERDVNTDKSWFHKKSHESVDVADVVSGYEFHKKRVILTPEEEAGFRCETKKCLSICAFCPYDEIQKELYFLANNMNEIVPDPRQQSGCDKDLCAFIEALRRRNVVAIAKRVYTNNKRAWPFAIFACPEHDRCLLMGKLPFKNDFNEKYVAGKQVPLRSEGDEQIVYEFLDCMEAKADHFVGNGSTIHPLAEHLKQNPNRDYKYEYLVMKYLNLPMNGDGTLCVHPRLLARSQNTGSALCTQFQDSDEDDY